MHGLCEVQMHCSVDLLYSKCHTIFSKATASGVFFHLEMIRKRNSIFWYTDLLPLESSSVYVMNYRLKILAQRAETRSPISSVSCRCLCSGRGMDFFGIEVRHNDEVEKTIQYGRSKISFIL